MDLAADIRPRRLLLHACCGPCLIEPHEGFASQMDSVTVFFSNSNIHPAEEYARRRDALAAYAATVGVEVIEAPYEPSAWSQAVAGVEARREERCRACYRQRLAETASYAAEHGYDAISTTLYVSPYQLHDAIREVGQSVARANGVAWVHRDFRERHRAAINRAREAGMYLQNYCGCSYSIAEAERTRAQARARRKAAKAHGGAHGPTR